MNTAYDEVLYPDNVFNQTHPGRLGAIGRLLGLATARPEKCRVLELGCGGGNNLITMAHSFPESEFLGVDLAARPIKLGQRLIKELELENVQLAQMDLRAFDESVGSFDYIITHGVYSWVPNEIRDRIMMICRAHLEPSGIAYISYNAHPGSHLREIAGGIMNYHAARLSDPQEQAKQGRALLDFLTEATPEGTLWKGVLQDQCERLSRYTDSGLYHDDLSRVRKAFYFHEFMDHASNHELQFLAEAEFHAMEPLGLKDSARELLARLEKSDVVMKEQYLDFLRGRGFRQTLLCHASVTLDRTLKPESIQEMSIAAETVKAAKTDDEMTFESKFGTVIGTDHPVAKAALAHVSEIWPREIAFEDLLKHAQAHAEPKAERADESAGEEGRELCEFLVRCYKLGVVQLQTHACLFVTEVSDRPAASPLARGQLRHGDTVSNLRHIPVKLLDSLGQHLVKLMDGSRDREALLTDLEQALTDNLITIYRDGKPIEGLEASLDELRTNLDDNLRSLAQMALLVS